MKRLMLVFCSALAAGSFVALAGCSGTEAPVEKKTASGTPPAQPKAPFAQSGGEDAEAMLKELETLKEKHQTADEAFRKDEKDEKLKKEYIAATMALANNTVNNPGLAPTKKYPEALRLYREVIKLEPKNKDAIEWRNIIEGIYKDMGRPIPE